MKESSKNIILIERLKKYYSQLSGEISKGYDKFVCDLNQGKFDDFPQFADLIGAKLLSYLLSIKQFKYFESKLGKLNEDARDSLVNAKKIIFNKPSEMYDLLNNKISNKQGSVHKSDDINKKIVAGYFTLTQQEINNRINNYKKELVHYIKELIQVDDTENIKTIILSIEEADMMSQTNRDLSNSKSIIYKIFHSRDILPLREEINYIISNDSSFLSDVNISMIKEVKMNYIDEFVREINLSRAKLQHSYIGFTLQQDEYSENEHNEAMSSCENLVGNLTDKSFS